MDEGISRLIYSLPTLTKDDVDIHDFCPICFVDFKTILEDSPSDSDTSIDAASGLTKLSGCSHVFCRKDLVQWIRSWHGSCPICRNIFSDLSPRSESDDDDDDDDYEEEDDYDDDEEEEEEENDDEDEDDDDDDDDEEEDDDDDDDDSGEESVARVHWWTPGDQVTQASVYEGREDP